MQPLISLSAVFAAQIISEQHPGPRPDRKQDRLNRGEAQAEMCAKWSAAKTPIAECARDRPCRADLHALVAKVDRILKAIVHFKSPFRLHEHPFSHAISTILRTCYPLEDHMLLHPGEHPSGEHTSGSTSNLNSLHALSDVDLSFLDPFDIAYPLKQPYGKSESTVTSCSR